MAIVLLDVQRTVDVFYTDVMDAIIQWRDNVGMNTDMLNSAVQVGISLLALFALVWTAAKLYPVIAGEEKLSVLPILRPFALALILMNWQSFVDLCRMPGHYFEQSTREEFMTSWQKMRSESEARYDKIDKISIDLMTTGTLVERAESSERAFEMQSSDVSKSVSGGPFNLGRQIAGMAAIVMGKIKRLFFGIIEFLCLLFMNVVVCGVFFMQTAAMVLMLILGPLAFAFSCLDPWRSSWTQWFARFFSVTLWSPLAYIVCWAGAEIMYTMIKQENDALDLLIAKGEWEMAATNAMWSSDNFMFPLIILFIAFGMFIIFPLSTWVIQTSGGHAVISAPVGAAGTVVGAATMLLKK
ncbi:MAG: hypothetical protein LBJ72_10330 [Dysgonamonadaceae bacterium]|jgi:hypothetical protein|nr:hypothetical protein [Dysgonamonadaceae bacterium]